MVFFCMRSGAGWPGRKGRGSTSLLLLCSPTCLLAPYPNAPFILVLCSRPPLKLCGVGFQRSDSGREGVVILDGAAGDILANFAVVSVIDKWILSITLCSLIRTGTAVSKIISQ